MERWRKQLEKTLAEVNSEISVLKDAKEACERAFEAKALPHDVTTECLSIREGNQRALILRSFFNTLQLYRSTLLCSNYLRSSFCAKIFCIPII